MNAKKARETSNIASNSGRNLQVNYALKEIEYAARKGINYVVVDWPHIMLFPEDYKTLQSMGYEILLPTTNKNMRYFGVIRW